MTYADKINLIKARKNLSNERLGAIINVCGGAVGDWSRGEREPHLANRDQIDRLYDEVVKEG